MQDIIELGIRSLGVAVLWLLTFGRYRASKDGLLLEGATGLCAIAAACYLLYAW
jgi:hypothetical protein